MEKAEALANELGIDVSDVTEVDSNTFSVGEEEYLVLDYDEADEKAKESIQNLIDDVGIQAFTPSFQDYILNNWVEGDFFQDCMDESNHNYAEDVSSESSESFESRLVEELYNDSIITDEDFEVDEDGEPDYQQCKVDSDELIDMYVDSKSSEDPVEWLKDIFGERELSEMIRQNPSCIDWDSVIESCIEKDGRGPTIASYDGVELELAENGRIQYYAYRVN